MSVLELPQPPTDAISSARFSPDGSTLLVGAWDSAIHIYRRGDDTNYEPLKSISCDAPVLDVAWNADSNTFYSVGLDHEVAAYTLEGGEESRRVLSTHDKAANKIAYSQQHNIVISTSWDGTMHIHEADGPKYIPIKLAAKPFAVSLTADKALVTMAERKVHVYALHDLKVLIDQAGDTTSNQQPLEAKPWQERESSLKFMTRATACMPDGTGFAASSIEGRVGVEWFDEEANNNMYAFKCHRDKTTSVDEDGQEVPVDIIYPVNAIAFHPVHGTFATGGGDGVVAFWDANSKRRVRQYPALASSVAALDFSPDGKYMVIGVSPGFEDGKEQEEPNPAEVRVYVRELGDGDAKGRPAKEK